MTISKQNNSTIMQRVKTIELVLYRYFWGKGFSGYNLEKHGGKMQIMGKIVDKMQKFGEIGENVDKRYNKWE